MQGNVGKTDQMIRYVLAIVLIAVSIVTEIYWILIPAIVVGFTAATSWCGLYKVLGIDTVKKSDDE